MFLRYAGLTFLMSAIISGCVSTPVDGESGDGVTEAVSHAGDDVPVGDTDFLGGADPKNVRTCRYMAPTGTYVKRKICGRPRDDRALIPVISSPPNPD